MGRETVAPSVRRTFPVLALAAFSGLLGMGIIIPLIPIYMELMELTGIWIGILFAAYSGTRVLLAPVIGRISDRRGRRPLLALGLMLSVVAFAGYVWALSPWQLVLVRFVHGAAGGMIYPITMSYLGDVSPRGKEGQWMGYFNAIVFSAFGFGPLLGGVITQYFSMSVAFISMSVLNFLSFIIVLVMLPESKPRESNPQERASFRAILASGKIRALFSNRFAVETGWGIWMAFLAILAGVRLGIEASLLGTLLFANALAYSLMMIPFGRLADRVSKNRMIVLSGIISGVLIAFTPVAYGFWFLLLLSVISAIIGAAEFPPSSALTIEEGRNYGMASTISIINMATSVALVVGPILGGVVLDYSGIDAVFYVAGFIIVLGAVLYSVQVKRLASKRIINTTA